MSTVKNQLLSTQIDNRHVDERISRLVRFSVRYLVEDALTGVGVNESIPLNSSRNSIMGDLMLRLDPQ